MLGLLDERHARGCDGKEFCTARPVPFGSGFAVVYMEWCSECGAVDWDYVDIVEGPEDK